MVAPHLLSEAAFVELARGAGGSAAVRLLCDAQLSKHQMLLHTIADAADGTGRGRAAFRAGYELLARIQALDPAASTWLLGLPHLGGWAHDCLIHFEQGTKADFAHFACLAAAAAVRTGISFELDVPVRDGRVQLPGLGSVWVDDRLSWIRLGCDGDGVTVGNQPVGDGRLLVPDGGGAVAVPRWSGTPMLRVAAGGLTWNVLLETDDPYLDRYTLPMAADLSAAELRHWQRRAQSAWEVLVRHHRWAAEPMAETLSAIVPLMPQSETDMVSATTPAAFGAIATSWPPDAVTLAETLVHEFQHVKLCGLMDMVPLVEPGGEKIYAPWRQDPRPAGGLLQGIYAHLGIVRFWRAQQAAETDPDDILRAQVLFARWRPAIDLAVRTVLQTGCLTSTGVRFADLLRAGGQDMMSDAVSAAVQEIADEAALDHWLTWQLRHTATDPAQVTSLAAVYQRGEACPSPVRPAVRISEEVRKVDSSVRSRLLNMRYLAPPRYRDLCADGTLPLSEPDRLLISNRTEVAVRAYRERIADSADPQPDAWIGLALALHRLAPSPLQTVLATRLALIFDVHARIGGRVDPLDLVSWFA